MLDKDVDCINALDFYYDYCDDIENIIKIAEHYNCELFVNDDYNPKLCEYIAIDFYKDNIIVCQKTMDEFMKYFMNKGIV